MYMLLSFLVCVGGVSSRFLNDEEYYELPELFHLDDYDECLSRPDSLYCLGTFHLTPSKLPNKLYQLMEEYTEETYTFNHTQIHRGICVTSRCPALNNTHLNRTASFQACVSELMAPKTMDAALTTFYYCHEPKDKEPTVPDAGQVIYLTAICVLVLFNIVGTLYHMRTKDNPKKIQALMAWSVIGNWKLLTSSDDSKESSLGALHGIRVCIAIATCLTHAALIFYTAYIDNPRVLEIISSHPLSMLLQNSTAMEQMFVVMAAFLYAYQLRKYNLKNKLSCKMIPLFIAKRVVRLLPVSLVVVGYAATWWSRGGGGPARAVGAGAEAARCRDKFWTHALFVNNLVEPEQLCVVPTWYLAVDMQMHIMSSLLLVPLLVFGARALLVLGSLFVLACALNAGLAYIYDWMPMLYITVSPENLRTLFHDVPSFAGLYISPWGSMPACFLGLILGYVYFSLKDGQFVLGKYKWLLKASSVAAFVLMFGWVLLGYFLQHIRLKMFMAVYAALERSLFQLLLLVSYVVISVVCGFLIRFLAWRGWRAMSRLSLPVMTVHWLVNMSLVGAAPKPLPTSVVEIGMHGVTTAVYTFLLAIPITVLIEMPTKKTFDLLA